MLANNALDGYFLLRAPEGGPFNGLEFVIVVVYKGRITQHLANRDYKADEFKINGHLLPGANDIMKVIAALRVVRKHWLVPLTVGVRPGGKKHKKKRTSQTILEDATENTKQRGAIAEEIAEIQPIEEIPVQKATLPDSIVLWLESVPLDIPRALIIADAWGPKHAESAKLQITEAPGLKI